MRPLAIIESDDAACAEMRSAMEAAGFRADCFADGASALSTMHKRAFSLAILDLALADTDSFAVCQALSRLVPVITVTADRDEELRVRAFAAGADDCVVRPLAPRELVARVRNVLRRAEPDGASEPRELEALSISISEMRIRRGDEVHELSRGETEILALLLEHAPTPLTAAQMAEILPVRRSTIESRIKSLRRKVGKDRLVTRGRFGYQLM